MVTYIKSRTRDSENEVAEKRFKALKWPKYLLAGGLAVAGLSSIPIAARFYYGSEVEGYFAARKEAVIERKTTKCVSAFAGKTPLADISPDMLERARTACRSTVEKWGINDEELVHEIPKEHARNAALVSAFVIAIPVFMMGSCAAFMGGMIRRWQSRFAKKRKDGENGGNEKPRGPGKGAEAKSPEEKRTGFCLSPHEMTPLIGMNPRNPMLNGCKSMVVLSNEQALRNGMRDWSVELGFTVSATRTEEVARAWIDEKKPDAFVINSDFPYARELIRSIKMNNPKIMVLVIVKGNEPLPDHPMYAEGADAVIFPKALEDFGRTLGYLKESGEKAKKRREMGADTVGAMAHDGLVVLLPNRPAALFELFKGADRAGFHNIASIADVDAAKDLLVHKPKAVLVDAKMPGVEAFVKNIRAEHPELIIVGIVESEKELSTNGTKHPVVRAGANLLIASSAFRNFDELLKMVDEAKKGPQSMFTASG